MRFFFPARPAGAGALAVGLLAGCATQPKPLYYWGAITPA